MNAGRQRARRSSRSAHLSELQEDLNDRVMAGFGGVAEYGITVRWDKNFLKIIRLLLERRASFAMFGGVRFGGTITVEQAFEMGFDHVALALGAGKPTLLAMPGGLARGVRMASDFLMALQLTGAAKADSIANLQLRLPERGDRRRPDRDRHRDRGDGLLPGAGREVPEALRDPGRRAWRRGRARAASPPSSWKWPTNSSPTPRRSAPSAHAPRRRAKRRSSSKLIDGWGGVTIAYRRRLIDAPSYTLNHEEVEKAMEEGIRFTESLTPTRIDQDATGHAERIHFKNAEGAALVDAGARGAGRRRHAAQHRAGARGCRELPGRRPVFPGAGRRRRDR